MIARGARRPAAAAAARAAEPVALPDPYTPSTELPPPNGLMTHLLVGGDARPAGPPDPGWGSVAAGAGGEGDVEGEEAATDPEAEAELNAAAATDPAPSEEAQAPPPEGEQSLEVEGTGGEQEAAAAAEDGAAPDAAAEAAPAAAPDAAAPAAAEPSAPAAPAAGAAGAGDDGGLAEWRARVRAQTRTRFRTPAPSDVSGPVAAVGAVGGRVRTREATRRAAATADVARTVPPAPEAGEGLPPPPPIPVPAVEAAVTAVVGKELPAQTLPEVKSYTHTKADGTTQEFRPSVAVPLPAGSGVTVTEAPPPAPAQGAEREGAEAAARVREAGATVEAGARGTGALVLGTAPRPGAAGAPPGPPIRKADVASILGRLRASTPADAAAMLVAAREALYPRKSLQMELPELGDDLLGSIETEITASIEAIRAQAGVEEAAVEAAAVQAREAVATGAEQATAEIEQAGQDAGETIDEEGQESAAAIAGARDATDDANYQKAIEAGGGADPDLIYGRRDALVQRAYRRMAPEDVRYEREGKDRLRALDLAKVAYNGAYAAVARNIAALDAREAAAAAARARPAGAPATPAPGAAVPAATPPAPAPAGAPLAAASPAETWALERQRESRTAIDALITAVTTTTKTHRDAITRAKHTVSELLSEWAEHEVDERSSWWESLWARFRAWSRDADAATAVWKEARDAALLDDMRGDLAFAADLTSGAMDAQRAGALQSMGALSDAQKAIVASYFGEGPDKGNPLAAVAAGMRVRIAETQRERLASELNRRLLALPPADWDPVAKVAESESAGVNIVQRGNQFYAAVDQWGTDESAVYAALGGLTSLQRHALDLWYQAKHGTTIDAELEDELEDAELDRARALMSGDTEAADAAALNEAIAGAGTDEAEIWRVLRNKTPEERERIKQIYLEKYGEPLEEALADDMEDDELARGRALLEGNVARADAIGLEMATTGTWYGGADTEEIDAIYTQIRGEAEAEAARNGWDNERLQAEILRRNQAVDAEHRQQYVDKGGLEASFQATMSGPELDLALGLAQNDMARADAARLEVERRSFVTDDEVVNKVLESQYTRARTEVGFDQEADLRNRRELTLLRGLPWNERAEREAMAGRIEQLADERARRHMSQLEQRYDASYSKWGKGGLQVLIAFNMSGNEQDKARDLLRQGGRLRPEQEVLYAVRGAGTDVDALKRLLKGKTPAQIAEIERAWAAAYPREPPLRARIMEEVSGRDAEDLDLLLEGEPQTPQEKLARAERRLRYEQTAYALGGEFSDAERESLEEEVAKLRQTVAELETAPEGSDRAAYLQWELDQREVSVESAVEEHRRGVDALTDTVAMVAAITAAIVVTALTWGAAGPAIAGMLGAIAATEATIIAKLALKGSAYSEEELLVDVASGVVDAALAFATAGVGNALLRVKAGVPVGALARLGTSSSMAKRMLAHGVAEGIEGFISSVPSAVVGTLVDENTYRRGDMLTNLVTGIGMGAGLGTVMSGGMGSFGGRAVPDAALLHVRVDPQARAAQFHAERALDPTLDYDRFLRQLEAGEVTPDPDAALRFQRAVRSEAAAALPPGSAHLLDDVAIDVVSDAEFRRLTRSASGQAVTIIENGRPRILLREGADISVLREEGIHALQVLDRRTARTAAMLDEAQMARWNELPLQTKIDMYRAKLDLEIDAQHSLISSLDDALDAMPPGTERRALQEQLDTALENLRNLAGRRVELDSFSAFDRLLARFGRGPLGARLDQPPRLFAKKKPTKAVVPTPEPAEAAAPAAAPAPQPPPVAKTVRQQTLEQLDPKRIDVDRAEVDRLKAGLDAPTHPLGAERSTRVTDEGTEVRRVGEPWTERGSLRGKPPRPHPDGNGDLYRIVEYYENGVRRRIEETVVRGTEPPVWRPRGSELNRAGRVGEAASLLHTRGVAAAPPEGVKTIVSIGDAHQSVMGSGNGFDEVYFRFKSDGNVEIVIVEVKNYKGWVPFEDFTAVSGHTFKDNWAELRAMLTRRRDKLPPALRDLSDAQLRALRKEVRAAAANPKRLTLEIRTAPGTRVGSQQGAAGTTPALTKLKQRGGFPGGRIEVTPINPKLMAHAEALADIELDSATRSRFGALQDDAAGLGRARPPYRPVAGHKGVIRFDDVDGRPGVALLRSVTHEQVGRGVRVNRKQLDAIADETVAALKRKVAESGFPQLDLHVFLDLAALDGPTRKRLEAAIERRLAKERGAAALRKRLTIF